ncbi:MAG: PAS domain-containing protein [Rhodospirillales bacterium]|nr:PAS domain-containing protein [Rhodospirillales bacterium]
MGIRLLILLFFSGLIFAAIVLLGAAGWLLWSASADAGVEKFGDLLLIYGGGAGVVLVALLVIAWASLENLLVAPLASLIRSIQTAILTGREIELTDTDHLGEISETLRSVTAELAKARKQVDQTVGEATRDMERQKGQLEAILRDLHEGVIVCTLNHKILLYNHRALQLLQVAGDLGLGRSLFRVMNRQPFLHALERLSNRLARKDSKNQSTSARLMASTADGRYILDGQMSLILDSQGNPTGYAVTFEDRTSELAALGKRERLLGEATEGLRQPLANLRAATEVLYANPDMESKEETAFKDVILKESNVLSDHLESMAADYHDILTSHWPMSDIYSANLLNGVVRRLREEKGIEAVMTGLPQWLHGDSYSLVELIDFLVHRVQGETGCGTFDLEAAAGQSRIYIDIIWQGPVLAAGIVDSWMDDCVEEALGGLTARHILQHHKAEIWSQPRREGYAHLRTSLPPSLETAPTGTQEPLPPRPEFYDFNLPTLPERERQEEFARHALKSLTFVVFDTETTGLNPSQGDEIISIAGVRVVNGRILTGESFSRLVNPQRDIPKASIRFHGITDDMVREQPPIQTVLPLFRNFVGNAVLVAHNAAFDMKFIKLKESGSGAAIDNPVLDTLLLSVFLHDHTPEHSLDAIAERFSIEVRNRHTALGDSLVTAGIFLRMIDLLDARGIHTLEQAIEASNRMVEVRAQQARL